jgi:hypothetical protein
MDEEPRGAFIAAHVESISTRTYFETERLALAMLGRCWPGGPADRIDLTAVEWVRRWGPARLGAPELDCSCPAGRCRVCN